MNLRSINGGSLQIEYLATSALKPDAHNARKHSRRQITRLKTAVAEFGFTNPILVDEHLKVIAGHARLRAAKELAMEKVPCIRLEYLSEPQKTALAIADNKLADLSEFDPKALAAQLAELCAIDFPIEVTGFDTLEVDILFAGPNITAADPADKFVEPKPDARPVSHVDDLWLLGRHRLLAANALEPSAYERLLDGRRAEMVFTDPPNDQRLQQHLSRPGHAKDGFTKASEAVNAPDFKHFLSTYMAHLVRCSVNGSIHFHCMDWRHLSEILDVGAANYSELKALCVWNKTTGRKGPLYRSKHQLVMVYKNGTAPNIDNLAGGRHGRHRTDVWDFPDAHALRTGPDCDLPLDPTVKPVALVAEAIRDCSNRGGLVLDPFAGFGTTILAAERTGRKAAAIEIDRGYVDTAIRRWQKLTGGKAVLAGDGRSFEEVKAVRLGRVADHD